MASTSELCSDNQEEFYVLKFPLKLWRITNDDETGAIQWSPSGQTIFINFDAFQIHYLDYPVQKFKTRNMTSFVRQLNMYGFRKLRSQLSHQSAAVSEFYNPNFCYGRPDLLCNVKRKTIPLKMRGWKKSQNFEKSQDRFYEILLRSPLFRNFWKIPDVDINSVEDCVIYPTYQVQVIPVFKLLFNEEAYEMTADISREFKRLVLTDPANGLKEEEESDCEVYPLGKLSEGPLINNTMGTTSMEFEEDPLAFDTLDENAGNLLPFQSIETNQDVLIHIPEPDIPDSDLYESLANCFSSI